MDCLQRQEPSLHFLLDTTLLRGVFQRQACHFTCLWLGCCITGIAVAKGVRVTPAGKNVHTNVRLIPEVVREFWLVRAPHGAIVPPNPKRTAGSGSCGNRTTMDEGPAEASSSWSRTSVDSPAGAGYRGDRSTADKHSGHGSSAKSVGSAGAPFPWGPVYHEPGLRQWQFLLREGSCFGQEAQWSSESLTTVDSQGTVSSGNWTSSDKSRTTSAETSPMNLSPSGVEVTGIPAQLEPVHRRTGPAWWPLGREGSCRCRSDAVWLHNYGIWWSWHYRHARVSELDAQYGRVQRYGKHGAGRHGAGGHYGNTHHRQNGVTVHSAHWPVTATHTAWYPELSHQRVFSLSHENSWRCPLLAWMCIMGLQTWLHMRETTACSNNCWTFIGSNHHSTCHWTSRCGLLDPSLCISPQLPLVHRASSTVACHCFYHYFRVSNPRPLPCINKKFMNSDGHQMALMVQSARVYRIQRSKSTKLNTDSSSRTMTTWRKMYKLSLTYN